MPTGRELRAPRSESRLGRMPSICIAFMILILASLPIITTYASGQTSTQVEVSCSRTTVKVGATLVCKALVVGPLSGGPVTWSSSGLGSFSQGTCKHYQRGESLTARCNAKFTATLASPGQVIATEGTATGAIFIDVKHSHSRVKTECDSYTLPLPANPTITCKFTIVGYHPVGTLVFIQTGTGSVALNSTSCVLANQPCMVTMTGGVKGTVLLKAAYLGDANNLPGTGTSRIRIIS